MNFARLLLVSLLGVGGALQVGAFTFTGPFKTWMTQPIGYQIGDQFGGPLAPDEGFRWNVPTIYYAFDRSFIEYFGTNGIAAVESAIKVYSDLPAFSTMRADLSEYALNTRQVNFAARAAGLTDLKSQAMNMLIQQLGIGPAEQHIWNIRARFVDNQITNYTVVKLNFDPVSFRPSSYVNGAFYTYEIFDPITVLGITTCLASEIKVSDLRTRGYSSVANSVITRGAEGRNLFVQDPVTGQILSTLSTLSDGQFFFGLTRDDVGALRRLYSPQSLAVESLTPDAIVTGGASVVGGSPWDVLTLTNTIIGTNVLTTNSSLAIRPGMGRLKFGRVAYDSIIGQIFNPFVSSYNETIVLSSRQVTRRVTRLVSQPDILFTAKDLGTDQGVPIVVASTTPQAWINNGALNTHGTIGGGGDTPTPVGPGVVSAPNEISFTSLYPVYFNFNPGDITESAPFGAWGSFDASPTPPVVYPLYGGVNFQTLQQIAASGGLDNGVGDDPWFSTIIVVVGTNTTTAGTSP